MDVETTKSDETETIPWIQFLRQLYVCIPIWSFYFIVGLAFGCLTVTVPQLIKESGSSSVLTDKLFPWITSISSYTAIGCVFILTVIAHFFGRKKTVFVISISSFAASVIFYFSRNAAQVFFSQILYAVPIASQMTVNTMILTEYSSTEYRGIFLTLKAASCIWGIWVANAIGIFTHYKYIGLLSAICSSYCFIAGFFIPESPYWLAHKGKYDDCTKAHRWLKGEGKKAEKELDDLICLQQELRSNKNQKVTSSNYIIYFFKIVQQPEIYKPLLLCSFVYFAYHISGKMVCAIYAIEIMKEITHKDSTAHICVLVLDGFSVLGMYLGCGVSKFVKRRKMLLVSATVGSVFLIVLSIYLYLVKLSVISRNVYIIVTFLAIYSMATCCGPVLMSTSICGELLPVKFRSICICCVAALTKLISGTIYKISPLMFGVFKVHGTFLVFGISSLICIAILYKYLPETKDKSIYDIAVQFKKKDDPEAK